MTWKRKKSGRLTGIPRPYSVDIDIYEGPAKGKSISCPSTGVHAHVYTMYPHATVYTSLDELERDLKRLGFDDTSLVKEDWTRAQEKLDSSSK